MRSERHEGQSRQTRKAGARRPRARRLAAYERFIFADACAYVLRSFLPHCLVTQFWHPRYSPIQHAHDDQASNHHRFPVLG
jgi:hypothetical protein